MEMNDELKKDIIATVSSLKHHIDHGRIMKTSEGQDEPLIIKPIDDSKFNPLYTTDLKQFLAVDCSTYTLRLAANLGVYLLRVAYALVNPGEKTVSNWNFKEKITAVIGSSWSRMRKLRYMRFELESEMALNLIKEKITAVRSSWPSEDEHSSYLLLDGAGYFGLGHGYNVALYQKCKDKEIPLLTISKRSPTLHDVGGRDLLVKIAERSPYPCYGYYPIDKANKSDNLYGDVTAVKLCVDSPLVFRCDVMDYLLEIQKMDEILSPLTAVSNDIHCLGYPISLFKAHKFTSIAKSQFIWIRQEIKDVYKEAGIEDYISHAEQIFGFSNKLHSLDPFGGILF